MAENGMKKFDLDGDGRIDESEMLAGMMTIMAPVDRERICNDLLNTSVMSALVGGFALGSLSAPGTRTVEKYIYMLAYTSVHACTCSALTSAFLYAAVNGMEDAAVKPWSDDYKPLLMLPMLKFVVGVMCYMVSVILTSWRDLSAGESAFRSIALFIGISSVSMVWMTFFVVQRSMRARPPTPVKPAQIAVKPAP